MKVLSIGVDEINVFDLQPGQFAVITKWSVSMYVGDIVYRYKNCLISLGRHDSWGDIFKRNDESLKDCMVRVLPHGSKIEI